MDMLENRSNEELLKSLLAEAAKAKNELACLKRDSEKIQSRLNFILVLTNTLIDRSGD